MNPPDVTTTKAKDTNKHNGDPASSSAPVTPPIVGDGGGGGSSSSYHHSPTVKCNGGSGNSSATSKRGRYDAEKCRVYIANQTKVSKIDRFAAQISKADDVECELRTYLRNILTIFMKQSAQNTLDFLHRCKDALKRHHQDRMILISSNSQRKNSPSKFKNGPNEILRIPSSRSSNSMSEDLYNGPGARLLREILSSNLSKKDHLNHITQPLHRGHNHYRHSSHQIQIEPDDINHDSSSPEDYRLEGYGSDMSFSKTDEPSDWDELTEQNYLSSTTFEPASFVKKIEISIRNDLKRSECLSFKLNQIRQKFEKLAHKHRLRVDLVYAAEEERQSASVIRRSAYNFSVAAIRATSTPIHVQKPRYSK